ncbi:ElyC/SanA/YdcF family protein [Streptococcus panodentis]|uniref:DUF218 domain-containing protein n=1 Tax=Streptococcus panodentis TaxID=1581472 RepID=A0ABS5AVX0_9STRE|nr:ElyC/SanA/YdcF family protein [Streptococcus panodentis]MBP2620625.1 hypothetical protein [Streptococcus panodentis]
MKKERIAANINLLGQFCGRRDLPELSQSALQDTYGFAQADVFVLFGGSVLAGGDVLAAAIRAEVARTYIIVGGAGHTTDGLRQKAAAELPRLVVRGLSEAEIFAAYLKEKHHAAADYLECQSTNCGNNITYLLELLEKKSIDCRSIILCQDATMQARMEATLRKHARADTVIINYAAYRAQTVTEGQQLVFAQEIRGMWELERYISLLMGEIPRLRDDKNGYGPRGKNYLVHVTIPAAVEQAFAELTETYGGLIRKADPLYASKENKGIQ